MLRVSSVILAKNLPSWLHLERRTEPDSSTKERPQRGHHWLPRVHLLKNRPMGRAFTVKTSLLLPGKDVPDDDGLRVILSVHQGAKSHQVPATEGTPPHLLHASTSSHVKVTAVWVWRGPVHASAPEGDAPGTSEAARTAAETRGSSTSSNPRLPRPCPPAWRPRSKYGAEPLWQTIHPARHQGAPRVTSKCFPE